MLSNRKIARFVDCLDRISQQGKDVPGLIMSSPGYGKTSTIEMFCELKDYNLTTLIASQYAPDDILGLQVKDGDKLKRLPPAWFNDLIELSQNGKRNVLFIDEITTCDEFIQAPLLNLIFSRTLGGHKLPTNTIIVAAGNYVEELNGAFRMTLPLINRFLILNLYQQDYDFSEVILNQFDELKGKSYEDKSKYLGLNETASTPYWDLKAIVDTLNRNILQQERVIGSTNSAQDGLLGFVSIRSVTYCLLYLSVFCNTYSSYDWVNIVGDTLGKNNEGFKISRLLESLLDRFKMGRETVETHDLTYLLKSFMDHPTENNLKFIEDYIRDPERLTQMELVLLRKCDHDQIKELYQRTLEKLQQS